MKNILITGASGYIGQELLGRVSQSHKGHEIFALYYNNPIVAGNKNITPIKVNLSEANEYKKLPKSIDKLIHLAGDKRTFLLGNEGRKQFYYNLNLTKLILRYLNHSNCNSIIFASSVYIYSGVMHLPFSEDRLKMPKDYLGLSKFFSESLFKVYSSKSSCKTICLRIFTTYGSKISEKQFVDNAINRLKSNSKEETFYNPNICRDFIHKIDVVEAFIKTLKFMNKKEKPYFNSINIATGKSTKIKDLIFELADLIGTKKQIQFGKSIEFQNDIDHAASIKKMQDLYKWKPSITLTEGLKEALISNEKK